MRYRALQNGDSTFGSGYTQFYINSPEAVGQAVLTRLLLFTEEWFLDTSEGTPYATEVLGTGTQTLYDVAIQDRILNTQGVASIVSYNSTVQNRVLTVNCTVDTIYSSDYTGNSTTTITASLG